MKRRISGVLSAIGLILLILDAKTGLAGAKDGIELCIMTVIPSLFPFFVLSTLLTAMLTGTRLKLLRPVGRLCKMPEGTESLLLIGLVGGYPTGAQTVMQAYESGALRKEQAQRLLGFCSNAGPAFIFGICGSLFPERWIVWLLWAVHILSALVVGVILPGIQEEGRQCKTAPHLSLPQALDRALKTSARVCGWVILFRIIIAFFKERIVSQIGSIWTILISGLLELTNGCCQLFAIENIGLRFLLASVFLAFGGICVMMQTASVIGKHGLGNYIRGKVLQTVVAVLICLLVQFLFFPVEWKIQINPLLMLFPTIFLLLSIIKYEKKSSIPVKSLV